MSVKLRLRRLGRSHLAYFQIVAAEARDPRDGRFIEKIGDYNPNRPFDKYVINHEVALKWLSNGGQPTETVHSIFSQEGILLKHHLRKQGKSQEEIQRAYDIWKANNDKKTAKAKEKYEAAQRKKHEEWLANEKQVRQLRAEKNQSKRAQAANS